MNIYAALKCFLDKNADPDALDQARVTLREFLRRIDELKAIVDDQEQQPVDTYPALSNVLAEEGVCIMLVCSAPDMREALAKKGFGDLARRRSNDKIIEAFIRTVEAKGGKLPMSFERLRRSLIWATAQRLVQEAASDWPEATERTVRIVRRRRDGT